MFHGKNIAKTDKNLNEMRFKMQLTPEQELTMEMAKVGYESTIWHHFRCQMELIKLTF
jgi:hypothetical protein